MIRHLVASFAFCAMAGGAFAGSGVGCEVETRAVTSTVPGADCALTHLYAPQGEEGLGAVENLWQGYVAQAFHETLGCARGETQVVVDCADGTAYSFAPAGAALMDEAAFEAAKTGAYGVLSGSIRKMAWDHVEVAGWERANELTVVDLGSVLDRRVALGTRGETYDLTCGCKLHNPGSPGAR